MRYPAFGLHLLPVLNVVLYKHFYFQFLYIFFFSFHFQVGSIGKALLRFTYHMTPAVYAILCVYSDTRASPGTRFLRVGIRFIGNMPTQWRGWVRVDL